MSVDRQPLSRRRFSKSARAAGVMALALCLGAFAGLAAAKNADAALELHFCGQQPLHTYPLSTEVGLQGLLLPFVAVINRGARPVEITSVEIDLLRDGRAVDTRRLARSDLAVFGTLGRQLEMAPSSKASFELLCGDNLLPKGIALAGPVLASSQGLLISNQAFAFDGNRDSLRIRVSTHAGAAPIEAVATLPISTAMAKTRFIFPVRGVWVVKSGPSFHTHHRWGRPSEFGLDIVKFAADGRSHKDSAEHFTDYYAYGEEVLAAADGRVVRAVNNRPEPTDLLQRPGETFEAFSQRTAAYEQTLLSGGIDAITGNHIMIDHGNGEYSLYAHLQPGSVRVRVGEAVKAGDPIAKIGGSGNALVEPHLHFHVCDQPTPLACAGIPTEFTNVETPFASFAPRPLQSGDIVIAK